MRAMIFDKLAGAASAFADALDDPNQRRGAAALAALASGLEPWTPARLKTRLKRLAPLAAIEPDEASAKDVARAAQALGAIAEAAGAKQTAKAAACLATLERCGAGVGLAALTAAIDALPRPMPRNPRPSAAADIEIGRDLAAQLVAAAETKGDFGALLAEMGVTLKARGWFAAVETLLGRDVATKAGARSYVADWAQERIRRRRTARAASGLAMAPCDNSRGAAAPAVGLARR